MRNKLKSAVIVSVLVASFLSATTYLDAQPGAGVSFQVFYDNLSPYGQWVSDPYYGYVWVPEMAPGFRPYYTGGHWVMTDFGNMWVSDYPWGWAPFHYGRWTYDSFYGWVWIPGHEWGPAWVSWRSGGEYYGWAPLRPGSRASYVSYSCPDDWWVFVQPVHFYEPFRGRNYYGPRNVHTVITNTTIINNTYVNNGTTYYTGPRRNDVESVTHKSVTVYKVQDNTKPGSVQVNKNEVSVYRPQINTSATGAIRPAPSKSVKTERPIEKPQAISINNGHPKRLDQQQATGNNQQIKNNNSSKPDRQPVQVKKKDELIPSKENVNHQPDVVSPGRNVPDEKNENINNKDIRQQQPVAEPADKQQKARQQQQINRQRMQQRDKQIYRQQQNEDQKQRQINEQIIQQQPRQRQVERQPKR